MRHSPALIGLALLALLATPSAHAQASPLCDQLRDAPALSPYVQRVLERADRGLNYINDNATTGSEASAAFYWRTLVENAGAAVIGGMDTARRITSAMQDLTSRSACLRYDAILLSCKIEQVRQALNERLDRNNPGSAGTLFQLQELLIFLFDRDRHLAAGATDPWYADPDWGRVFAFDPPAPGFCCRTGDDGLACEEMEEAECNPGSFWQTGDDCEQACGVTSFPEEDPRICPYNSDYAYPTEGGYGCDETVMPDAAIVADEKAALIELRAAVERLRQEAGAAPAGTRPPALTGCASQFGHCADEGAQTCSSAADCEDGAACLFQRGTCLNDPAVSCSLDADCVRAEDEGDDLAAVCLLPPVSPPAAVIRRGPFGLESRDLSLMNAYMNWSIRVGASRPFGSAAADPRDAGEQDEYVDPIDFIINQGNREYFRQAAAGFAADQARLAPLTETSDRLQDMLMPLREAVADFSVIASAKEGVRELVRRFADLLHHSCGTDPCQTDLERVWSMANTDECFAYADGTYLEDDCATGTSRAQKCADAAGVIITVPACEPL